MESLISPPSPRLVWYLLGILLLANIIHRVRRWYRPRHIPGPTLAGWTSLWLTRRYLKATFFQDVSALVLCTDADTIYRISSVRSDYRKSGWYTIARVSRHDDNVFIIIDPVLHKERKKYITPGVRVIRTGVAQFEEGTDRALKTHFYVLDAIGEVAWSDPLGFLKQDRDVKGVLAVNDAAVPLTLTIGDSVTFWKTIRKWSFYYLLPTTDRRPVLGPSSGDNAKKIVAKCSRLNADPKRDILQSFLYHGLQGEELVQEVGFHFSGTNTISSLLHTTFFLLLTHPAAYARLQSELDAVTAASAASDSGPMAASSVPLLRDAQARALPYLQAVIRDVLRLFPPLCAPPLYKEVARGGDTRCGRALPGGTLVATGNQQWQAGRAIALMEAEKVIVMILRRWVRNRLDDRCSAAASVCVRR
ncbi:cytochrome P450 [Thermothelomyces heterothallicus CBS 202.75]|uniref:cytochrome P450 n=1 Tax=Thermothelomyces heterothallicus CBS 202.75 TaxID=1149848 RepID=UPI0037448552